MRMYSKTHGWVKVVDSRNGWSLVANLVTGNWFGWVKEEDLSYDR